MRVVNFNLGHRSSGVRRTGGHSVTPQANAQTIDQAVGHPIPSEYPDELRRPNIGRIALTYSSIAGGAVVGAAAVTLGDYVLLHLLTHYHPDTYHAAVSTLTAIEAAGGGIAGGVLAGILTRTLTDMERKVVTREIADEIGEQGPYDIIPKSQ